MSVGGGTVAAMKVKDPSFLGSRFLPCLAAKLALHHINVGGDLNLEAGDR